MDSLKISHKEGYKQDYKNFEIINKKGTKEKFRLLKNGDSTGGRIQTICNIQKSI